MKLFELFEEPPLDVVQNLRGRIMDLITPLAANKVPFVSVQQIVDKLNDINSGVHIDRALIMTVLDPETVKIVKKIEGDRIYLTMMSPDKLKTSKDDEEKREKNLQHKAAQQARKELSNK